MRPCPWCGGVREDRRFGVCRKCDGGHSSLDDRQQKVVCAKAKKKAERKQAFLKEIGFTK